MDVTGVLLAAGAGSRFGGPTHKLLGERGGRPLWRHALDQMIDAGPGAVVVVTGAADLAPVADPRARCVACPAWRTGQAASLAAAIATLPDGPDAPQAVLVGLADLVGIGAAAYRAVAGAPDDTPIVVATYAGRRGPHPVRLRRDTWPLLPRCGDEPGRQLIGEHPEWVTEVPCLGSPFDIDTVEDWERWTSC